MRIPQGSQFKRATDSCTIIVFWEVVKRPPRSNKEEKDQFNLQNGEAKRKSELGEEGDGREQDPEAER